MQKTIIIAGIILIILGIIWPFLVNNLYLGRLPDDIMIQKKGFTLYFPIVTCFILSVLISLVVWFLRR